jgi:hypothetical protein
MAKDMQRSMLHKAAVAACSYRVAIGSSVSTRTQDVQS